jgi:excinuclease ABC subunit A
MALDNHGAVSIHSTERACPSCHRSFEALDPKLFSYNSSQGWCPKCRGFGELFYLPEDVDRGARADAIEESWFGWQEGKRELCPECLGARLNLRARAVRWRLANQRSPLHCFESSLRAPGVRPSSGAAISEDQPAFGVRGLRASLKGAASGDGHTPVRGFKSRSAVSADALLQTAGPTIDNFSSISVGNAHDFFRRLRLKGREARIARDILPEIRERLKFLCEVGLGYLQLGRAVPTLSGGEAQRIRLAAQLGSNLSGVLYVLDEPTIGLHARDNEQLLATLKTLQSRGNSLVVVEHDEETMRNADYIVDLGPGAGARGGELVAGGTLAELLRREDSITGQSLRGQSVKNRPERGQRRPIDPPKSNRRRPSGSRNKASPRVGEQSPAVNPETTRWLTLHDATAHNLQSLTVEFPLNRFVVVTGVSGSGKSTLIRECLLPALTAALQQQKTGRASKVRSAATPGISGFEPLKSVYEVDQSPIGRTPRSTPATYVGFFDDIRQLFSQVPEARLRGYSASRFSYNSAQGRCPECEGTGTIKLEMSFLPPAFVRCETCQGLRFSRETLDIEFRGKNIAQVLDFGVAEAIEFFSSFQKIRHALEALRDTGLDYLKLGQTSPTLSGGEAQRVKLVTHLLSGLKGQPGRFDASGKRNMFILEEPTIGLHMSDVRRLVEVLQRLVDHGHSVIVIEHNLDLIAEADWIMDLGPEGGDGGGQVVATGTPEAIARTPRSHTGRFLRKVLAEK